ncbi:MAG TPA: serine/threonine-protein kinase, partial [Polyangia bacterium]
SSRPALTAAASADPLIGAVLADRYEIIRRIGEGGMGAVYEGRHVVLRRQVAVKVLLEKFVEKTELVARLLQEARLASAIGHENIVDVTDFGTTADGRAFVVMEFLEGEALSALVIREAPLAIERCLRIARQIVSALGAAHGKGIVHRDVKPENVFLLRRGEQDFVKVVDFGVSKAVRSREDGAELLRLTRTGMVLGTPLYMSPEQARGNEDVDVRADVWAVGVLLYECLTGEVPFRANNYLGVISQVLTQEIQPPSRLRPELGIPPAVEAVVMRAMAKDRNERYQDMATLERDLDRLLAGDPNVGLLEEPTPRPEAPAPPRARWHLMIAAIVVIGIGVSIALVRTEEEHRRAARAAATATPTAAAPVRAAVVPPRPTPPAVSSPASATSTAAAKAAPASDETARLPSDRPARSRSAGGDSRPNRSAAVASPADPAAEAESADGETAPATGRTGKPAARTKQIGGDLAPANPYEAPAEPTSTPKKRRQRAPAP